VNFSTHQANIIFEFFDLGESLNLLDQAIEKLIDRLADSVANGLQQPVFSEFLVLRAGHFVQSIGKQQQQIVEPERAAADRVVGIVEQAKSWSVAWIAGLERFNLARRAVEQKWAGVTAVGETQLAGADVEHGIKGGGQKRLPGSAQDGMETSVDLGEKFSRIGRQRH